jgi:diadenosine tetraphosphate (Ap4A) HIT family hydrolase
MQAENISYLPERKCPDCGFTLWIPLVRRTVVDVGFVSDAHFPGRCIVSLRRHHTCLEDLPDALLNDFWQEVVNVGATIKKVVGVSRINYAVLGNLESHVHAHVIPRGGESDPQPNEPPWSFPEAERLSAGSQEEVKSALHKALLRNREPD